MRLEPILPVEDSITIDTMLNFDGDFDSHGNGDVTYKDASSAPLFSDNTLSGTAN